MTKALLHPLGQSLSYGRLSLLAKVLWPMLLSMSDDQGRGTAEADAVRWYVCPNVPEITIDVIPGLLQEMQEQGMIVVYECDRGTMAYQVIRWWEYQSLRWARPSKWSPPDGWIDRIRYSNRGDIHQEAWDSPGGFVLVPVIDNCTENSTEVYPDNQPNLTQPNLTKEDLGADAPTPTTLPEWQTGYLDADNKAGFVGMMCKTLYPAYYASRKPNYGWIGKLCKKHDPDYMLSLIWQHSARPPAGDPLRFVAGILSKNPPDAPRSPLVKKRIKIRDPITNEWVEVEAIA